MSLLNKCAECKEDFYGEHLEGCSKEENLIMCSACDGFYLNTTNHECGISWLELAQLTHVTQVERFGFCTCEDNQGQENPYADCPTQ